jgi:hypothetical protein
METYMQHNPNPGQKIIQSSHVSKLYDSIMTLEANDLLKSQSQITMNSRQVTPSLLQTKQYLDKTLSGYKYSYLPYHVDTSRQGRDSTQANWFLIFSPKHTHSPLQSFLQKWSTVIFPQTNILDQPYQRFDDYLKKYVQEMSIPTGYFLDVFDKALKTYDILMYTMMIQLLECPSYNTALEGICYRLKNYLDTQIQAFNTNRKIATPLSYTLPKNQSRSWRNAHWITLLDLSRCDVVAFRVGPSSTEPQKEKKKK